MQTIRDRFAGLQIMTVPGSLGEPHRVVDADAALDFAEREVFKNLMDIRTGRPSAVPFPEEEVGDFELGLEVYRSFQNTPANRNPVIAMGTLARRAGMAAVREEPTKFAIAKRGWADVLKALLDQLDAMNKATAHLAVASGGQPTEAEDPPHIARARALLVTLESDPNV